MPKRARDLARIGAAGGVLRAGPVEVTAKAIRTTDLTLGSGVSSVVDFDTEQDDTSGMYSLGEPAVMQIRHRGRFAISYAALNSSASALALLLIEKVDTAGTASTLIQHAFNTGSAGLISNTIERFLSAGDRVRMTFTNNTGGSETLTAVASSSPSLQVTLQVRGG